MGGVQFSTQFCVTLLMANAYAIDEGCKEIALHHCLMGLLSFPAANCTELLRSLIDLAAMRKEIWAHPEPSKPLPIQHKVLPKSSELKRVLAQASQEAQAVRSPVVGSEHLLLAVLRTARSDVPRFLERHGITYESLAQAVKRLALPPEQKWERGSNGQTT